MLKKNLVDAVAADSGLPKKTVREVMAAIVEVSTKHLVADGEVRLFGLGKLYVSHRGPKKARDLWSGASVIVPARNAVVMAPSDSLVKAVNVPGKN